MSAFEIYLIMQADTVVFGAAMTALTVVVFVIFGNMSLWMLSDVDGFTVPWRKVISTEAVVFSIAMLVASIVPSTKTLVAMYSVPTLLEAAQSEQMTEIGQKSLKAVDKLLSDYLGAEAAE